MATLSSLSARESDRWADRWINRACSLMELNQHKGAYETLSAAAALFPGGEIIPYPGRELEVKGGLKGDRAEAREWISLFRHEAVVRQV